MLYTTLKVVITAITIVAVSEVAKRSSLVAAILASLPLVSVLAMIWLYVDTHDPNQVIALSKGIFWMVLPSLVFFIVLPLLLGWKVPFALSMGVAIGVMSATYYGYTRLLMVFGINL